MKKFALLAALVLVGCGDSTPECGDKEVKNLAKEIVIENYFDGASLKFFQTNISNIRTANYNKDIGLYTCKATFTGEYGYPNEENDPLKWISRKIEIVYTVQLNSEKRTYVEAQW